MKQTYKGQKFIIPIASFIVIVLLLAFSFLQNSSKALDLKSYENMLRNDLIKSAQIDQNRVILNTNNGEYFILKDLIDMKKLSNEIPIHVENELDENQLELLMIGLFLIVFLTTILFRRKRASENVAQSRSQAYELEGASSMQIIPTTSDVSFSDIAGIKEVKDELNEIVDFLKNPQKYKQYGIKLPKGVLLVGPPGVGKTMVAKAIAGEAGVPFFYQSGASFVQIYVGMGAKRVRELFSRAKSYGQSIIFIDEIDAVGKARGGMRNDEREATLNQLLTEIDGFEDSSDIIVIAATNKMEMIDEALLRSGRFDRRIFLQLPDFADRVEIIKVYLKNKPINVNVEEIAKMTVGFSGASLSTLVNEAAINALKRGSKVLEKEDFWSVRDKVLLGKKKVIHFSEEEKQIQALYQAARALSAFWFDVEFDKIMLLGDGLKGVDREIESKTQMMSKIKVFLSGLAVSQMMYNETFSNAKDDLNKARELAAVMVEQYGMGETLLISSNDVNQILETALKEVKEFLKGMSETLHKIKNRLLENESISKEELKSLINETY